MLRHPREVAIVVGLTLGGTVAFYTYTTYMQKFLVNSVGLTKETSTIIAASTLFFFMCLQPVVGAISDVVGRRRVLMAFGILGTLMTVPILTVSAGYRQRLGRLLPHHGRAGHRLGLYGDQRRGEGGALPDRRARHGRRLSLRHHVALFGGTAEYVALYLKEIGWEHAFYWYVTGCIAISFIVYAFMRDTRDDTAMHRHI